MHLNQNALTIAVDIDFVLTVDFTEQQRVYFNNALGKNISHEEMIAVQPYIVLWGSKEEIDPVHDQFVFDCLKTVDPRPDAVEVLSEFKKQYNWVNVTARKQLYRALTRVWVRDDFPGVFKHNHILYTAFPTDLNQEVAKGKVCKEMGFDILIDDSIRHILDASRHGVTGFLFGEMPWSEPKFPLPANVYRTHNWYEVKETLNRIKGRLLHKKTNGRIDIREIKNIISKSNTCMICSDSPKIVPSDPYYGMICFGCISQRDVIFTKANFRFPPSVLVNRSYRENSYDWRGTELLINNRHCKIFSVTSDCSSIRFTDDNSKAFLDIGYLGLKRIYESF